MQDTVLTVPEVWRRTSRFAEYYKGAKSVGLKVGAYFYSQATTQQEAVEEANKTLSIINGCSFEMPVAFDYEYANDKYGNCVGDCTMRT